MGAIDQQAGLSKEALMQRWTQVLADPQLHDLPYKIELDQWGDIRMSPTASPRHMRAGFTLGQALEAALGGIAFQEGAIVTPQGLLTADVVWCSMEYVRRHDEVFVQGMAAMPQAPEICVEIASPSNQLAKLKQKVEAYLAAGAIEGWIVLEDLTVQVFNQDGEQSESKYHFDLVAWRRDLMI